MAAHYVVVIPFNNRGRPGEILACYRTPKSATEVGHRLVGPHFSAIITTDRIGCPVCDRFPFLTQREDVRSAA